MTDPLSNLTLFNAIATAGKTIFDIAQGASKLDTKQQLMEVYDNLVNLKREAAELEDQNRVLKEKLRFKSEDFDFKNPFWFEKTHPDRPLCPMCFAKGISAPMSKPNTDQGGAWSRCLACNNIIHHEPTQSRGYRSLPDPTAWS